MITKNVESLLWSRFLHWSYFVNRIHASIHVFFGKRNEIASSGWEASISRFQCSERIYIKIVSYLFDKLPFIRVSSTELLPLSLLLLKLLPHMIDFSSHLFLVGVENWYQMWKSNSFSSTRFNLNPFLYILIPTAACLRKVVKYTNI